MMNYYVYLALARGRSDALLREAEAAGRAKQARLYRRRAGASGGRRSPLRRLFRRLRPVWAAWTAWATWPGRAGRAAAGRRVVLRDGSKVVIRQVHRDDAPLLADGFARLGPESRRLRFLRRKDELSAAELRYFTDVDHHDHEALGALDRAGGRRRRRRPLRPRRGRPAVSRDRRHRRRRLAGPRAGHRAAGPAVRPRPRRRHPPLHRAGLGRQRGHGRAAAQRQRRPRPPRARHRGVRDRRWRPARSPATACLPRSPADAPRAAWAAQAGQVSHRAGAAPPGGLPVGRLRRPVG